MRKKHKQVLLLLILLPLCFYGKAQTSCSAGGGMANGGGTASYTIGQVLYENIKGQSGTISMGVQNPYLIEVITGIDQTDVDLQMSVYPNPTPDILYLSVGKYKDLNSNMRYYLYNLKGKQLENKKIIKKTTSIQMGGLASGTYLLKIIRNKQAIKIYKIVKQ
ncbi:MAG: T9SS type A sorting domain-containing protein [Marinifilum sp.]|jgi:hypothetical protein|nr:T9SS type A sorting domain-containing protein [Marinifilum sp.]